MNFLEERDLVKLKVVGTTALTAKGTEKVGMEWHHYKTVSTLKCPTPKIYEK